MSSKTIFKKVLLTLIGLLAAAYCYVALFVAALGWSEGIILTRASILAHVFGSLAITLFALLAVLNRIMISKILLYVGLSLVGLGLIGFAINDANYIQAI